MGFRSSDRAFGYRNRSVGVFHVVRMEGRSAASVSLSIGMSRGVILTFYLSRIPSTYCFVGRPD